MSNTPLKRTGFKPRAPQREAFATYQQWGGMKVAPDAGSNHRGGRP